MRCKCKQGQSNFVNTCFQVQSGTWLADTQEVVVAKHAVKKRLRVVAPLQARQRMGRQWPRLGHTSVVPKHLAQCMLT